MIVTILEIFSSRLQQLMATENLSARKLHIETKISRKSIGSYLKGLWFPRYDILARLADYFEVSTDYMLGK